MKIIFKIFLLFLIQIGIGHCVGLLFDDRVHLNLDGLLQRIRRQTNKTSTEQDANTRCVVRNLKDIESKLEKSLPPEKNISKAAALAKPHQIFSNADPNTLLKFCTIYKASRFRLAACGESQMKMFAAKALAIVDFICIDRYNEFVSAFPCIQNVDQALDVECKRNCSRYESAAEKLNTAGASIVKKYAASEIKDLFAQSCLYVICFTECQKPLLAERCGDKVLQLEMTSIAVTFRNLDDLMNQSSAAGVWPNECRPLNSMGHDSVPKPLTDQVKEPAAGNSNLTEDAITSAYPRLSTLLIASPTLPLQISNITSSSLINSSPINTLEANSTIGSNDKKVEIPKKGANATSITKKRVIKKY